jgi:hypothetical protein
MSSEPSADDDATCGDPQSQTFELRATGFDAWEGLAVLGCFNPTDPAVGAVCDDATVTGGEFMIMEAVCTGASWQVYVFDANRGLNCNITRSHLLDSVFALTPADCTCASPDRVPSTGCSGDVDGGGDGDASASQDALDAAADAS